MKNVVHYICCHINFHVFTTDILKGHCNGIFFVANNMKRTLTYCIWVIFVVIIFLINHYYIHCFIFTSEFNKYIITDKLTGIDGHFRISVGTCLALLGIIMTSQWSMDFFNNKWTLL